MEAIQMNKIIKKVTLAIALVSALSFSLAGCGTTSATKTASAASKSETAAKADVKQATAYNQYIVIEPGSKVGPDGKMHDAYINGDIKITEGQPVTLHFLNYDGGTHTYTSGDLGLNVKIKGSTKKGLPAETTYTFTPKKTGDFSWFCADKCDGDNGQWAMTQKGFMQGKITVLPADNKVQYVSMVMNPSYKLGSDGKLHDAYTPGNLTVKAGQPVELTVYGLGKAAHPIAIQDLGVTVNETPRIADGNPSVTTVQFTPDKTGKLTWNCTLPCDGDNQDWSMMHNDYMMGTFNVVK
jgi:heme/copper-type cytochrome/quinol oxidase subunit 2